ncbi:GDSL-type esterase/lipase family protein, partial [bacterium]|nr:GDSL-type esterase/lipase family protein [bacterium]
MSIIDRIRHSNSILGLIFVAATLIGPAFAHAQVIRILPLGDSITKGVDGSTDLAGYRNDLADSLTSEGVNFTFVGSVTTDAGGNHEGHDGFRADQVLANINTYLTNESPDIILLNIGTNDISDNQTTQSTRDEIASIIDAVVLFDTNIKIVLSSLTPRNGDTAKEQSTADLNTLIYGLYLEKRDAGVQIFYAGSYEVFRANPNYVADYLADNVHPNDAGYAVLAGVFFNGIMNALNNTDLTVNDNFERTHLGVVWNSDSENAILNGDMVNNAATDGWLYLSIFKAIENPSKASMKWGGSTNVEGLQLSGLALMLDSADPAVANGYAITARTDKKEIRLWQIETGAVTNKVTEVDYAPKANPTVGDAMEVRLSTDGSGHRFEIFIDGQSYGTLIDPNFLQGNGELQYSGIMLHGNKFNDIAEFSAEGGGDFDPPAQIQDLAVTSSTTTSASFSWTATGGNGNEGTASSYDMRYSTTDITNDVDFNAATPVANMPNPAPANAQETFVVLGLNPGTTYFFAIRALDASGNKSLISNVVTVTTDDGELVRDDFNSPPLSGDWVHDGTFVIDNNELSNSSTEPESWNLAVYTAKTNALEVAFTWGAGADAGGIDQGGVAVMLDAPSTTANGYVITRRPIANEMRLWRIINGDDPRDPIKVTPLLAPPTAGSEFRIVISSDGSGNHFTVFIDGQEDVTLTDPERFIEPATAGALYSGVMLAGGHNNNIDNFSMLLSPNQLNAVSGNNQTGTVGLPLAEPIRVKLVDGSGEPVEGQDIAFDITGGGGSLSDPSGSVLLEAESFTVNGGMDIADDPEASKGQYIHVPDGQGVQTGIATVLFSVPISGNYYMWGRAIHPNSTSDAFVVQIDGGQEQRWDVGQGERESNWNWDAVSHRGSGVRSNPEIDPVVFNLNAGNHLLTIKEGKDGTKLDQVLFTRDETFVPNGIVAVGDQFVATTDANGEAAATWTLGTTVGTNTARASIAGLTEEFTATGNPDAPSIIAKVSGENQNALPGQALANPLVVQLRDQYNNIVPNHETNWSVVVGNGTLGSSNPVVTDFNGQAQNTLTLSTNSSNTQVKVMAPGYIGPDVIFSMFAQAGDPDKIEKYAADSG